VEEVVEGVIRPVREAGEVVEVDFDVGEESQYSTVLDWPKKKKSKL